MVMTDSPSTVYSPKACSASLLKAPEHLNNKGCRIEYTVDRGRGVFASRELPRNYLVEISPVLLFSKEEYEEHGRYTVLDHYTFKWRDGRMALALGLGSLFNHSVSPNVSYTLDLETESIRYITTRTIDEGEELCIFYGHQLWFEPAGTSPTKSALGDTEGGWGGLLDLETTGEHDFGDMPPILRGVSSEIIPEEQLPFMRIKLIEDELEDELPAVRTELAWVVDVVDPQHTNTMIKWLKHSGLDGPALAHLKRIRKLNGKTTLLLTSVASSPTAPPLPPAIEVSEPYKLNVPCNPALTMDSLRVKSTLWPTIYAPRKKGELEPMNRGHARWAWEAMRTVVQEAIRAKEEGELPIGAYVPVPYDEDTKISTQLLQPLVAYDTRHSTSHPLHHATLNLLRKVADYRAVPALAVASGQKPSSPPRQADSTASVASDTARQNGTHYLLTSLTVFTSHEPCIMCSMALLHSRVKEVYYLKPMEKTGGCGGSACVPKLNGVNHRFGIARWKDAGKLGGTALEIHEATDA